MTDNSRKHTARKFQTFLCDIGPKERKMNKNLLKEACLRFLTKVA